MLKPRFTVPFTAFAEFCHCVPSVPKWFPIGGEVKIGINLEPKFLFQFPLQLTNLVVGQGIINVSHCVHHCFFKAILKD
jgi:hypothetical protein